MFRVESWACVFRLVMVIRAGKLSLNHLPDLQHTSAPLLQLYFGFLSLYKINAGMRRKVSIDYSVDHLAKKFGANNVTMWRSATST